jgi:hypothetical protein
LLPSPGVHPDLAAAAALVVAHEQRSTPRVKIRLGQRERLLDAQPTTPLRRYPETITNTGTAPLQVTGITFTGADSQDLLVASNGCLGPIAPTANCTIGVDFAPQAQGARTATLSIASNDPASPASVTLSGAGGQLQQGPTGAPGETGGS